MAVSQRGNKNYAKQGGFMAKKNSVDVTRKMKGQNIDPKNITVIRKPVWEQAGLPNINSLGLTGEDKVLAKMEALKNQVVAKLQQGEIPWRQRYDDGKDVKNGRLIIHATPKSVETGKAYTGLNVIRLQFATAMLGYTSNWFGTCKQWAKLIPDVFPIKGTHTIVCTAPSFGMEYKRDANGKYLLDANGKKIPELVDGKPIQHLYGFGWFHVVNLDDLEILSPQQQELAQKIRENDKDECKLKLIAPDSTKKILVCPELDNLPKALGCVFAYHEQRKAYYDRDDHKIVMPKQKEFRDSKGYYATLLHECVHATQKELNRPQGSYDAFFGPDKAYCREELVAEFACVCLMSLFGMTDWEGDDIIENSSSYIQGWLDGLKSDPKYLDEVMLSANTAVSLILKKLSGKTDKASGSQESNSNGQNVSSFGPFEWEEV